MFKLILVVVAFFASSLSAEILYTVTDLGTLGGSSSRAYGINAAGNVVGWSWTQNNAGQYAFLWSNGSMQNLGDLSSSGQRPGSFAYGGINNSDQVVGIADLHAFLYTSGSMHDLGTINGNGSRSSAQGINDNGQIVGYSWDVNGVSHAFLYSNGLMQDLGTFGGQFSNAQDINSSGQVVGDAYASGNAQRIFLYSNGSMQDIGGLGVAFHHGAAYGINESTQIVGYSNINDSVHHAFLWQNGSMQDLGTLGGVHSIAEEVNNAGQVVGNSNTNGSGDDHAFVFSGDLISDLNSLIDPSLNWTLKNATSVNDSGQIVGYGINGSGQEHAFLLTPIPEPSALLSLTLMFFTFWRRR